MQATRRIVDDEYFPEAVIEIDGRQFTFILKGTVTENWDWHATKMQINIQNAYEIAYEKGRRDLLDSLHKLLKINGNS